MSVGELAARAGVAVSAVHFYEAEGLISGWRTSANHRRYGRDVLRRIAIIKVAQRAGIPLKEIAAALATLPEGRTPTAKDWAKLAAGWKDDLDRRIHRLTLLQSRLAGCIGCGCLSVDACPLYNPDDKAGAEGSGPRLLDPD
nr:redox-sensitive transcriptional activator SoxR [Rhizobium halophytocola]